MSPDTSQPQTARRGEPRVGDTVRFWPGSRDCAHCPVGVAVVEAGPYEMGGTQVVYLTRTDKPEGQQHHDHIALSHVQVISRA